MIPQGSPKGELAAYLNLHQKQAAAEPGTLLFIIYTSSDFPRIQTLRISPNRELRTNCCPGMCLQTVSHSGLQGHSSL